MNDNPPFFKQALYTFRISESLTVNSPISNAIEAEDADENVLFYMLNGNVSALEYFRLSSDTNPVVLVNKSLDYDDCSTLYLNLTVRDTQIPGAVPSHTATTSIVIDITDADDKPPFFLPCKGIASKICISDGYTGNVNRNEQVSGPLTLAPGPLYAVDGDWGIGAPVEYAIISGNNDNVFNVDKTSGNITMNKAIDALGIIFLQVMASQTDDQLKYSTTSVVIEVKEKNSFPPTFEKSIYYGFILSNYATDTLVSDLNDRNKPLVVFAADDDFPDKLNPSLVYKIDNSTDFRILREGFIMTNVAITTPGIIQLQVSATDSSTNEMTSTMVSVEVIAAATTVPTTTTTTTSSSTGTGTTTTITPGTGTTITTVKDTGTTTTSTPGTGTTTTTKDTGTTKPLPPGTGTTTITTKGTGTTKPPDPETGSTTATTKGTGTTKSPAPVTGTTTSTTKGTGTTNPLPPVSGTTTPTTKGTGTTKPPDSGTGTTTATTKGTGTINPLPPVSGTTTPTTKGTGTTKPSDTGTGTTTATTKGTGTTKPPPSVTGTTAPTTKDTGTIKPPDPATGSTTTATKGTGTTTIAAQGTGTTTTSKDTGTTTTRTPGIGTSTTTPLGTGTTKSVSIGTGTTTSTAQIIQTGSITTSKSVSPGGASNTPTPRTDISASRPVSDVVENDIVFTVTDMAALGASLGAILALCLVALGFLIHKQYGGSIKRKLMKGSGDNFGSTGDRTEQLINDIDDSTNDPIDFGGSSFEESASTRVTMATAVAVTSTPLQSVPDDDQLSETAEQADDSDDKKVKSILTKELKEDVGYKSVWFREDAAPEVVVIEGVEDGEADDNDSEEDYNDQQEDDGDDDEEDLDPTFNATDDMSQNSIL
ncbi:uncharacterized protein ACMZJ9_016634 isoform 1-T1 [Mantella aurantiaca]